jgi:hypothetical protein
LLKPPAPNEFEKVDMALSNYLMAARNKGSFTPYEGAAINFMTKSMLKIKGVERDHGMSHLINGYYETPDLPAWHQDIFSDPIASQVAEKLNNVLELRELEQ